MYYKLFVNQEWKVLGRDGLALVGRWGGGSWIGRQGFLPLYVSSHRRETAEHSAGSFTRPLILSNYSDENLDVRRGSLVYWSGFPP